MIHQNNHPAAATSAGAAASITAGLLAFFSGPIGIAVAAISGLLALAFVGFKVWRHRQNKRSTVANDDASSEIVAPAPVEPAPVVEPQPAPVVEPAPVKKDMPEQAEQAVEVAKPEISWARRAVARAVLVGSAVAGLAGLAMMSGLVGQNEDNEQPGPLALPAPSNVTGPTPAAIEPPAPYDACNNLAGVAQTVCRMMRP